MVDSGGMNGQTATPAPVLRTPQVRAAIVSVAAGLAILAFKFAAYVVTGSVAIFSDAAESVVNVVAANVALISLVVAVRPPDKGHQYGHGKAEYISSATEGGLIVLAGVWVLITAILRFIRPIPLQNLDWGLLVLVVATAANLLTARFLLRVSRDADSMALEADARHLLADVLTSVGVLAGLTLAWLTDLAWLDAAVAAAVAAHIIRMGAGVYSQGLRGLMDTSLPAAEEAVIRAILAEHQGEIVEYHALRARRAGSARFIDLHLVLHRVLTVGQAHALCDHFEEHIEAALPGSDITIHVEPCGPDCPRCGP